LNGSLLRGEPAAAASPREAAWLWAGLVLAFSPALAELASHWRAEPWARYSALGLWLLPRSATALAERAPGRREGLLLVLAGLVLEVFAAAAGPAKLGRPGLVLGVLGMARALGHPPLRAAALAVFLVPVPAALARLPEPLLRPLLEQPAAVLASALGAAVEARPLGIARGEALLRVYPHDLGVPLAALFAGAAFATRVVRGASAPRALLAAGGASLLALPAQLAALLVAALLLDSRGAEVARRWLDDGPWLLAAVGALVVFEAARRTRVRSA
jgi:hypothetical protein